MRQRILGALILLLLINIKSFSQSGSCNLQVVAIPVGTSCSNICDGSVTFNTTGGTAPYTLNAFDYTFTGSQINAADFSVNNGNYSIQNNTLVAAPNSATSTNFNNAISARKVFPATGKVVAEASFYVDNSAFGYWGFSDTVNVATQYQFRLAFYFGNGSLYTYNNGLTTQVGNYSSNTWYDFKIEKTGSTVNYYLRRTGISAYTLITSQTTSIESDFFKLSATYRNSYGTYGGFQSKNWKIGGNPPTTGLCAGTYTYTIYDAVGCYTSTTVTIESGTGPSSVKLTGAVTPASCFTAANGAVALAPSGGVAPYSYGLSQNFQGSNINTQVFDIRNGNFSQNTDLREGINNSVNTEWDNSIATRQTFSDGGYLSFEGSFKMDPTADVILGFAQNDTIKDPSNVLIGLRYGSGNNLYAVLSNAPLKQLAVLSPATWYDFKIQKTGYSVTFSYRVSGTTNYTELYTTNYTPNIVEYKFAVLNYSNFFSASGGYNTKGWSILVTPKVAKLTPGLYTYTITDAAGCSATSLFTVGEATSPIQLSASLVNGSDFNSANGAVSISPAGGIAPYKYQFEEPFSDAVINTGFLTVRNGSFTESSSLRSEAVPGNNSWDNSVATNLIFSDNGYINATGSIRLDAGTIAGFGLTTNSSVVNDINQLIFGLRFNGTQLIAVNGRGRTTVIGTVSSGNWYDVKITKTVNSIKYYIKNETDTDYTLLSTLTYADTLKVYKGAIQVFGNNAGLNIKDWTINSNPPLSGLAPGIYNFRVYDSNGCYADASVNVPGIGSPMPGVTAPASVTRSTDAGKNYATGVALGWPQFSGDTTGLTVSNNAPATFPLGQTTITWTITNAWSVSVTATQQVTIVDTEAPGIIITGRTTFSTDKGVAFATVSLTPPTTSDNIGVVSISSNAPATFPLGTTTVTWTVIDAAGNISTAAQDVTIIDAELPTITAPADITVLANAGQYATGVNLGLPVYSDNVMGGLVVTNNAPSQFPVGSTKVTWTVTDAAGNTASAIQMVTVTNCSNYNVTVTSVPTTNVFTGGNANTLYLGYGAQSTQLKVAVPNTGGPYTYQWTGGGLSSATSATPTFTPTAEGNYTFTVTVKNANNCTSTSTIKICVIDVRVLDNKGKWDGKKVYICHLPPGNPLNGQTLSISINALNTHVPNHGGDRLGECNVICDISPIDTLPSITAPADISVNNNTGVAYATGVSLGTPSYTAMKLSSVTNNAPSQFPVGTTTVTWTLTDKLGRTATDVQTVTVVAAVPTITAPAAKTINLTSGSYATGVVLGTPSYSVSVNPATVTNDAPSQFPVGNTTVTWTIKDGLGRTTTAAQVITVVAACQSYSISVSATPSCNTYTGGVATNIYLGYGSQSATLKVNAPSSGAPYTYQWSGSAVNQLNSKTSATPVFSPTDDGSYTFTVTVTNKNGCKSTASITFCVKDIRVSSSQNCYGDDDDDDDYRCHRYNYNSTRVYINYYGQNYQVNVSQVGCYVRQGCFTAYLGRNNQSCGAVYSRGAVKPEEVPVLNQPISVKATPNPTTNYFVLQIKGGVEDKDVNVSVVDALGREVYRQITVSNSLVTFGHNLSNGVYYAEVIQGTEKKTVKLMKQ